MSLSYSAHILVPVSDLRYHEWLFNSNGLIWEERKKYVWNCINISKTCIGRPLKIHFIYTRNKEVYCIFKTCCI